ncbi:MAG: BatA domain-containing protein, partial [Planctomycetota bacterium]
MAGSFSFQSAPLWPLLAFAAVPIILHILDRRRAQVVDWPTLRFLLGRRAQARWATSKQHLLVASRTFAALALALAALGLEWIPDGASGGETPGFTIVVIDTSLSMSLKDGVDGTTRFDEAKRLARLRLGRLDPSEQAVVVSPTEESSDEFPRAKQALKSLSELRLLP